VSSLDTWQTVRGAHPQLICDVGHSGEATGAQLVTLTLYKLQETFIRDVV